GPLERHMVGQLEPNVRARLAVVSTRPTCVRGAAAQETCTSQGRPTESVRHQLSPTQTWIHHRVLPNTGCRRAQDDQASRRGFTRCHLSDAPTLRQRMARPPCTTATSTCTFLSGDQLTEVLGVRGEGGTDPVVDARSEGSEMAELRSTGRL